MISAKSKIPAGSVTLNSTDKIIADEIVKLERCPHKNASAIITQNFEKIKINRIKSDFGRKSLPFTYGSPSP
jgi:hypothetical protein